jgi:hypothetical protein
MAMAGQQCPAKPILGGIMQNGNTDHWKRVKTRYGFFWIDPAELERAMQCGRVFIKCWKRKDSDSETLHIDNILVEPTQKP